MYCDDTDGKPVMAHSFTLGEKVSKSRRVELVWTRAKDVRRQDRQENIQMKIYNFKITGKT
jgi:hypothetical protein